MQLNQKRKSPVNEQNSLGYGLFTGLTVTVGRKKPYYLTQVFSLLMSIILFSKLNLHVGHELLDTLLVVLFADQ